MKRKNFIGNFILFLFSVYFALLIGSFFISYKDFFFKKSDDVQLLRKEKAEKDNMSFEDKTYMEKYSELASSDKTVTSTACFSVFDQAIGIDTSLRKDILPLCGGISHKKVLYGNEGGYFPYRYTDKFGFFNNDSAYTAPDKVMIIGDSFGASAAVREEDRWDEQLKKDGFNCINTSVSDKALLSYLATLYEYGEYIKPRTVVMTYYSGNDFDGTIGEMKYAILKKYFNDPNYRQNLVNRQSEIDTFCKNVTDAIYKDWLINGKIKKNDREEEKLKSKYSFWTIFKLVPVRILIKSFFQNEEFVKKPTYCDKPEFNRHLDTIENIMMNMRNFVKNNLDAKFLVVYLPSYDDYKNEECCHKNPFLKMLSKNSIDYIDFSEEISKSENPLKFFPFELYGHYNEYGYKKLGEFIGSKLKKM